MFSLVIKDFLLTKKTILLGFIYMIFFLIAFNSMGEGAFISANVALSYLLIMYTAAYEEKNKADILLNSLPVKKRSIVFSKYVSAVMFFIISLGIFVIVNQLLIFFHLGIPFSSMKGLSILLVALIISVLHGIYLPIFFKFGYGKSRIINMILFLVIFIGGNNLGQFLQEADYQYLEKIFSQGQGILSLYMVGAILMVTVISYFVSLTVYKGREF